jgi:hypothetical protein
MTENDKGLKALTNIINKFNITQVRKEIKEGETKTISKIEKLTIHNMEWKKQ